MDFNHKTEDISKTGGGQPTLGGKNVSKEVAVVGTPPYSNLSDLVNITQSAGMISGGLITDSGAGQIDVATGVAMLKTTDNALGETVFATFDESLDISLTDKVVNWIYIDYLSGSPAVAVATNWSTLTLTTQIILGRVFRDGSTLTILNAGQYLPNHLVNALMHEHELHGIDRGAGLVVAETGTRNLTVSAGAIYANMIRQSIGAIDTSDADTFNIWYRDGATGWTNTNAQTQIDNANYDNDSGTLEALGVNDFGVHWIFIDTEGNLHSLFGQSTYNTLADAQLAKVPGLPPMLAEMAVLCARIIVPESGAAFSEVASAFEQTFKPEVLSIHNELAGLQGGKENEYYHLTADELAEIWTVVGTTDEFLAAITAQKKNIFMKSGDYAFTAPIAWYDDLTLVGEKEGVGIGIGVNITTTEFSFLESTITWGSGRSVVTGPKRGDYSFLLTTPMDVAMPAGSLVWTGNDYTFILEEDLSIGDTEVFLHTNYPVDDTLAAHNDASGSMYFAWDGIKNITLKNLNILNGTVRFDGGINIDIENVNIGSPLAGKELLFNYSVGIRLQNVVATGDITLSSVGDITITDGARGGQHDAPTNIGHSLSIDSSYNLSIKDCASTACSVINSTQFVMDNVHSESEQYDYFDLTDNSYFKVSNCSVGASETDVSANDKGYFAVQACYYFSIDTVHVRSQGASLIQAFNISNAHYFSLCNCSAEDTVTPITVTGCTNHKIFGNSWQGDVLHVGDDAEAWTTVTDSTELQAALDAEKKKIFLKIGVYSLAAKITPYPGLHLKGEGTPESYSSSGSGVKIDCTGGYIFDESGTGTSHTLTAAPIRGDQVLTLNAVAGASYAGGQSIVIMNGGGGSTHLLADDISATDTSVNLKHVYPFDTSTNAHDTEGTSIEIVIPLTRDITLENLSLDARLYVEYGINFTMKDIRFLGLAEFSFDFVSGIYLDNVQSADQGWVNYCSELFLNNVGIGDGVTERGIEIGYSHTMVMTNCFNCTFNMLFNTQFLVSNCHVSAPTSKYFDFTQSTFFRMENCSLGSKQALTGSDNNDPDLRLYNCEHFTIDGVHFESDYAAADTAIQTSACINFTITNCSAPSTLTTPHKASNDVDGRVYGNSWQSNVYNAAYASLFIPESNAQFASSFSLVDAAGSVTSGDLDSIHLIDSNYLLIAEEDGAGSAESFDVYFNFAGLTYSPAGIIFTGRYTGASPEHNIEVFTRDFTSDIETAQTATGGSTTTIVRTGAAWIINALVGGEVEVLTGAAAGDFRRILSNTADTLTVATMTGAVVNTDTYDIHGTWTRFTADLQDIPPNETTDATFAFTFPGDRTRFRSTNDDAEFRIFHNDTPSASHDLYIDQLMIMEELLVLTVPDTYYTLTSFSSGPSANVTVDAALGTMTIVEAGDYELSASFGIGANNEMDTHGHIHINDVSFHPVGFQRSMPEGYGMGSMGSSSFTTLAVGDVIKFKFKGSDSGTLGGDHGGFTIKKINEA